MPASQTTCIVPAEVRAATEFRFGMLTAFGPEENFAFPAKPADPKLAWNLQWTARIRHRSTTSWMDMPGMPSGDYGQDQRQGQNPANPQPRPNCRPKGLGGMMGGVFGGGSGC